MGRHSSPEQSHFYRSFIGWVGLWAVIAAVTGAAVWFIVSALGGPDAQKPVAADRDREVADEATVPEPTVSGARIVNVEQTPAPEPTGTPTTRSPEDDVKLITEGVSVQVLNGTADAGAGQAMADRLTDLGYTVVTVEESSRPYPQTTVFWSTDAYREAATALAERHGWMAEAKPANLADTVSLHVVVGADEV